MNLQAWVAYLEYPMILIGFALFLFTYLARTVFKKIIFEPIPGNKSGEIAHELSRYIVILPLVVIFVGAYIKYKQLEKIEDDDINKLVCASLKQEELPLAIREKNKETIKKVIDCGKIDYLRSQGSREEFSKLFRKTDFQKYENFLSSIRDMKVMFLKDYSPANPERPEEYGDSPLRTVLFEANLAGALWLVGGEDKGSIEKYPALLELYTRRTPIGKVADQASVLNTIKILIQAGMPKNYKDSESFRDVYFAWLQTQFGNDQKHLTYGARSMEWDRLVSDSRPKEQASYWYQLSAILAPSSESECEEIVRRTAQDYIKPRIEILKNIEDKLRSMLNGDGLRTILDPKHPLGARNVNVSKSELRDDDLVLDSYGLQSADSWASVGRVRQTLRGIQDAKNALNKFAEADCPI